MDVARAPERVDAGVLRDLIDPRLEDDLAVGLAHAPQRGDEDLLRHVLGAAVVAHHAADIRRDPPLIALEQQLERTIVACPHSGDKAEVIHASVRCFRHDCDGRHLASPIPNARNPTVASRIRAACDGCENCSVHRRACQCPGIPGHAPVAGRVQRLRAERIAGAGPRPGAHGGDRRVGRRRAVRARRRARRGPRHRPSRDLLERGAAGPHARRQAPPAAALRARHRPRGVPPTARCAPGGRQQRAARRRSRLRQPRAVRAPQGDRDRRRRAL